MNNEIRFFFKNFFDAESRAYTLNLKPDLDSRNSAVREMYSYAIDELYDYLGLIEKSVFCLESNPGGQITSQKVANAFGQIDVKSPTFPRIPCV